MKKNKNIFLISFLAILILAIGFFQFSQQIVGVGQDLEYSNNWKIQDLNNGNEVTEAKLKVPKNTSLISFTVDYDNQIKTDYRSSNDIRTEVKYEVFNYMTNSYEIIHNKNWNLKNYDRERTAVKFEGESVYLNGKPEKIEALRTGRSSYDRYYGCLPGMDINEAKQLNQWAEGTSSYNYRCLYPGEHISEHEYGDDSDESWGYEYFPELITLDNNYIKNEEIKFRISFSVSGSGVDSIYANDFEIDLFKLETPVIDTYYFDENSNTCEYRAKYTYQISGSDYYTRDECELQNSVIECYLDEQCSTDKEDYIAECNDNVCIEEKDTFWNDLFPEKEEPINEDEEDEEDESKSSWILFLSISIILIFIIYAIFKIRSKK